jgi:hypothetical protein
LAIVLPANSSGFLHLRHLHGDRRVHGVRHHEMRHALLAAFAQQHQPLGRRDMTGGQHESVPGNDRNHRFGFRQELARSRHTDERPILF